MDHTSVLDKNVIFEHMNYEMKLNTKLYLFCILIKKKIVIIVLLTILISK